MEMDYPENTAEKRQGPVLQRGKQSAELGERQPAARVAQRSSAENCKSDNNLATSLVPLSASTSVTFICVSHSLHCTQRTWRLQTEQRDSCSKPRRPSAPGPELSPWAGPLPLPLLWSQRPHPSQGGDHPCELGPAALVPSLQGLRLLLSLAGSDLPLFAARSGPFQKYF